MYWLQGLADRIDATNERVGRALSWLTLLLVIVTAIVALLRYIFSTGWVWMQDAYLWIDGTMFMMGAGYTLLHDRHVRVDFFYVSRGPRFRAAVDLLGTLIFLLPVLGLIAWTSFPYVRSSWMRLEGSLQAGGLPGVYLLKSILLLFCIPLAAQAISMAIRCLLVLAGHSSATAVEGGESGDTARG